MTDERTFEELVELFRQDFPEKCRPCSTVTSNVSLRAANVLADRTSMDVAVIKNAASAAHIAESCRYGAAVGTLGQPVCRNSIACELIPREDYIAE